MKLSITNSAKFSGVSHALLLVIDGLRVRQSTSNFVERCQIQLQELPDSDKYNLGMKEIISNRSPVGT